MSHDVSYLCTSYHCTHLPGFTVYQGLHSLNTFCEYSFVTAYNSMLHIVPFLPHKVLTSLGICFADMNVCIPVSLHVQVSSCTVCYTESLYSFIHTVYTLSQLYESQCTTLSHCILVYPYHVYFWVSCMSHSVLHWVTVHIYPYHVYFWVSCMSHSVLHLDTKYIFIHTVYTFEFVIWVTVYYI